MSGVAMETPSARAMRQLANRNNLAGLYLNNYLHQVERQKDFWLSDLDKHRLDVTDFLKNLHRCDSDLLPQSKKIREEAEDSDDDLLVDSNLQSRRDTHTAKTAPARSSNRRHRGGDNAHAEDCLSLDNHPLRCQNGKNGASIRRQMLCRRRLEEERAKESDFDKAEMFLMKLRQDVDKEHMEDFRQQVSRKKFTSYLLRKIQSKESFRKDGDEDEEEEEEEEGEDDDRGRGRMSMVYPIKRLGSIATKFKQMGSGRNTPADDQRGTLFSSPSRRTKGGRRDVWMEEQHRNNSSQRSHLTPRQRSVFEITEDDVPASSLPRPACMPDASRSRRDLLADTARAYGFGEAAVVLITKVGGNKGSPQPDEGGPFSPIPAQFNPLSRASVAERRRLQRQAKVKIPLHLKAKPKVPAELRQENQGLDTVRSQLHSRLVPQALDDRIKDFMRDLDYLERRSLWKSHPGMEPEEEEGEEEEGKKEEN